MTNSCEKEIADFDGLTCSCGEDGVYGLLDSAGQRHWYCGNHLWEASPNTDPTKTCDMMGTDPPSMERCARSAVVTHTNPVGETKYWCERCRRKWWPTEEEKDQDEAAEKRRVEQIASFEWVFSGLGWVMKVAFALACIYGLVAFVKWCWIHS